MTDTSSPVRKPDNDDEIDLLALAGRLWDGRWIILATMVVFILLGVAYALWQAPVYRGNALIQVEEKKSSLPGMEGLEGLLQSPSNAATEIQLIKSRRVLGKVVESLHLDIVTRADYFPLIGAFMARRFGDEQGELAQPLMGDQYAWGGERLEVTRMEVPGGSGGYSLVAGPNQQWELKDEDGNEVLIGKVDQLAESGDYALMVTQLTARPGTRFHVVKRTRFAAVKTLVAGISAAEKGKSTGIIELSYEHTNPALAEKILTKVGEYYVRQNVERSSAEAASSLAFLRSSLRDVRTDLQAAERRLKAYQVEAETIDISTEGESVLAQIVDLEGRVSQLEFQRADMEQRFQPTHPRYKAWASQMGELRERLERLNQRVGRLPETQQKLVRLRRDVEVGNKIYLQMLSNIQQLDIARAGTVGNVRVVDDAEVNTAQPVKPKRTLIVAINLLLGGMIGTGIVIVRSMLSQGIKSPDEIEKLGIPVYAEIPASVAQADLTKRKGKGNKGTGILAMMHPNDWAVESIRSLRTSLHFGMVGAMNNILMISGPSPGVGKTFVSANLAAVTAMAGLKVLLVDGDLRRGLSHDVFGVDNDHGLSELLVESATLDEVTQKSELEGLHFITRGQIPPNPSELLLGRQFNEFIEAASEKFDLVIIDTPPILAVTDAAIVGKHAGMTFLVTRFNANPARELDLTRRRFEQNGVTVKGAIFNAVEERASAYGYGYHYQYDYQNPKA